jgi:methionyl-tRNA formyltransferase
MARLVYLGTPEYAVPPLFALLEAGHQVELVVSAPDRRRGRGRAASPAPVKAAAAAAGLSVADSLEPLERGVVRPELGVVVAYGQRIPKAVLEAVPMVNVHFSLLPRWRGAAPLERAILAGDRTTGVCVMAVEEGLDTGPIYAQAEVEIGPDEHLVPLRQRLVELGSRLLVEVVAAGPGGLPEPVPQSGTATYARKLTPAELEIDWSRPSDHVLALIRLDRGASTTAAGRRLLVLDAARTDRAPDGTPSGTLHGELVTTGDGAVRLVRVQPEGRRPMSAADWLRGSRLPPGTRLGAP